MAADLVLGELVALGVRAVPQARVGDAQVDAVREIARVLAPWTSRRPPSHPPGELFADAGRRGGHDVEVAGVRRQEVAPALHLDEDARPGSRRRSPSTAGRTGAPAAAGSRARTRATSAAICRTDAVIASVSASGPTAQKMVSRMIIGGSAGLRMMIALPRAAPPIVSMPSRGRTGELVDVGPGTRTGRTRRHRRDDLGVATPAVTRETA